MMIKVGDDYLEFDGDIYVEKQVFNFETLETAGTFSYSFVVQPTSYNKRLLGILDISSNENASLIDNVQLLTDSGILLYIGYLIVENPIGIECSFFSENNNFFTRITGNVTEVEQLNDYDKLLTEDNIIDSWTATEGIVYPLVDRGALRNRKDAFMKLRIRNVRLDQNDWQPFIHVKDVVKSIMRKSGLKMTGELIEDTTYNSLITTNNNIKAKLNIISDQNISVATETLQTIPNDYANAIKINFELSEDLPQFNSPLMNWDTGLMRWTASYECIFRFNFHFIVSDDTKEVHWEIRRNGASGDQVFTRDTSVTFFYRDSATGEAHAQPGDYFELWAYVDTGTPGTVDIISGSLISEMKWTNMAFGRALVPNIKCRDFIKDIFNMFSVLAKYDPLTKTIETTLLKNVKNKQQVDLSQYVTKIQSINNFEFVSKYGQNNYLAYQAQDNEDIDIYNQNSSLPYGSGVITVPNRALEQSKDIVSLNFTAPFVYKNDAFGIYMILLDYVDYVITEGIFEQDVTSVTDSSGNAEFNYSGGSMEVINNNFVDDAEGKLYSLSGASDGLSRGGIDENETTAQIIAVYLPNATIPNTFRFSASGDNGSVPESNAFWGIVRLEEMTNPIYNGDWEKVGYPSATHTNAGVAIFAKAQDGTDLDVVRQGLSFGDITGMNSLSLKDTYYSDVEKILNDPVKPLISMVIPENVYLGLDFTVPVRIETETLNGVFIINKCSGYRDSFTPCTFEPLKLSV